MIIIRNTKLFQELKECPEWRTLFENFEPKDPRIPAMAGDLDRIEIRENQIIFYDCGCFVGGKLRDNTFCVVPEGWKRRRQR